MGGDDSQKLLPWRGSAPLQGANLRLNYEINNVTETAGWNLALTPPSLAGLAVASATGRLGHFWKAEAGQFWRAPKSATAAVSVVLVASAFFMVVFILSAVDPRMTIHHSGGPGRQGGSSTFWKKEFDGDPELPECSSRQFPISPSFGHNSRQT